MGTVAALFCSWKSHTKTWPAAFIPVETTLIFLEFILPSLNITLLFYFNSQLDLALDFSKMLDIKASLSSNQISYPLRIFYFLFLMYLFSRAWHYILPTLVVESFSQASFLPLLGSKILSVHKSESLNLKKMFKKDSKTVILF